MVTHPSRVLENISVSFLDANASLYWDNTFPVKPFEKVIKTTQTVPKTVENHLEQLVFGLR